MFPATQMNKSDLWIILREEVSQEEVDFINAHLPEEVEVAVRNLHNAYRKFRVRRVINETGWGEK